MFASINEVKEEETLLFSLSLSPALLYIAVSERASVRIKLRQLVLASSLCVQQSIMGDRRGWFQPGRGLHQARLDGL